MLQRTEFSLGPITLPPGEILASVNDGIDRIASALFAVMGIMLVQKLAVGMVYFVTLKLLLPIGLVLVAITSFKQGFIPEFRRLGFFLIKLALLIAVFFPTPALLGNYINSNYFDSRIEASQKTAEEGIAQLIAESDTNSLLASVKKNSEEKAEAETDGEAPASEQAKRSWSDGAEHIGETEEDSFFHSLSDSISSSAHKVGTAVSDTASKIGQTVSSAVDTLTNIGDILKAKAEALANKADHIIDELFTMLAIFIINVIVLPLFVLALFVAITKSLAPRKSLDVIWKNLPSTHAG